MSGVNWAMGLQQSNPGEAFMQAFSQGQQRNKEMRRDKALAALIGNPQDQVSLQALAQEDPNTAMQFQQQQASNALRQQEALSKSLEARREGIINGAKLIRQMRPSDQATWDQTRMMAQQVGIDLSDVPAQFDETYVQGVVQLADTFAPPQQDRSPASYQEYERAQQDPAYRQFLEERRGPIAVQGGDGTVTLYPRSMLSQQPPQRSAPTAPPPPGFVIDNDGGPTAPPSGGFRP